ncbi:MAG: hypothetical protein ACR2PK_10850 [Acidimicrobiales bacterium]
MPTDRPAIDYSSGWSAETNGVFTQIAPTEEAFTRVDGEVGPAEGLGVGLIHQTAESLGLGSDGVTLEDLVEFNIGALGWTDVRDLAEVEIFGSQAIRARVTGPEGREFIYYQGVSADTGELFLLGFGAPTSEILDEFLPTWDAMVESITATEYPETTYLSVARGHPRQRHYSIAEVRRSIGDTSTRGDLRRSRWDVGVFLGRWSFFRLVWLLEAGTLGSARVGRRKGRLRSCRKARRSKRPIRLMLPGSMRGSATQVLGSISMT